jgi:hypothetical protein
LAAAAAVAAATLFVAAAAAAVAIQYHHHLAVMCYVLMKGYDFGSAEFVRGQAAAAAAAAGVAAAAAAAAVHHFRVRFPRPEKSSRPCVMMSSPAMLVGRTAVAAILASPVIMIAAVTLAEASPLALAASR